MRCSLIPYRHQSDGPAMIHPSVQSRIPYFLAVAETLSFRKAAQALHIAQPALSRSIRQLEQQLGFQLFQRSTRHVALTPAGEVLYRDGADAVRRLARACARAGQVAQGLSGTVVVGYSTFAAMSLMSNIIIDFRRKYPDATVALRLLASSEQVTGLDQGAIDVGFMMSNLAAAPLRNVAVSKERLIALVPSNHAWAADHAISLQRLTTVPIVIGTANRWRGFRKLVDDMFRAQGLTPNVVEEADDVPVLLQLVRSGFGCTILDASFIPTLPPGIRSLEIEDASVTLDIVLAWHDDNLSPLAAHFVDVATASIASQETRSQPSPRVSKGRVAHQAASARPKARRR
ncbi:LysR family transcriptional regulator [Rhodopseudomonas palustris]|nr:LysR family transcriptional regulator [Rhodopseudomonas palustris]